MSNTVDRLKEILKYSDNSKYNYWILISYKLSIRRAGVTFKETLLINIKEPKYNKNNIFDINNSRVTIEIEEARTIEFPTGSIVNRYGVLVKTPSGTSNGDYIYDKDVWFNPKEDNPILFDRDENFDIDFIKGVPCYYKRVEQSPKSKAEKKPSIPPTNFVIPIHLLLDFFFYQNTYVTNVLVNDFEKISHLKKIEPDILVYSSDHIRTAAAETIGEFLFTENDSGLNALMEINKHSVEWLNQAKRGEKSRAYIRTIFPFNIMTKLSLRGIYLTETSSSERTFLAFSITKAVPLDESKSFFTIDDELKLVDLADKSSTDEKDNKDIIEYNSITSIGQEKESTELSNNPTNNSLPESINDNVKNNKFKSGLKKQKIKRVDQLNQYVKKDTIIKEIEEISINYMEQTGNGLVSQYQAVEWQNFSFFDVFHKAIELLRLEDFIVDYLKIDKELTNFNSSKYRFLNIKGCQVETENKSYIIVESGANKYIGMFRCVNFQRFDLENDIRIESFLRSVINDYNYSWSKVNSIYNAYFQNGASIKIFRPMEHETSRLSQLLQEGKNVEDVINSLAMKLVKKIKERISEDIKENF
ncbi:MAG: hypothetical protein ABI554_05420 [Flavobacterium sp.]